MLAAFALLAGSARADGDPASDTLLFSDLFVPYTQTIPGAVTKNLESALKNAKAHGRPMRAAIIASGYDLGSVGGLWAKPEQYAPFLGQEIGIGTRDKSLLMVVMPAGFGFYAGQGRSTAAELRRVRDIKPGSSAEELARSATTAVERIAGVSAPGSSGSSPWRQRIIIALAAVAALALVVALSMLAPRARRRRRAETQQT
jgi:hypothetical protein